MKPSDDQVRAAIAEQAGDWLVRTEAGRLAVAERAALLEWLRASPVHVAEFLGVAEIARELPGTFGPPRQSLQAYLETLPQADAGVSRLANHRIPHRSARATNPATAPGIRRRWRTLAAAASILLALVAGGLWSLRNGQWLGLPRTYQTARGGELSRSLPDHSLLRLDTDSAVTVRFRAGERRIDLERGQADFIVTHDPARPFVVRAGEVTMTAVGTEFNVYRQASSLTLTVAEGTVAVTMESAGRDARSGAVPPERVPVGPGQQLRVGEAGDTSGLTTVDVNQALGWLRHVIVFDQRPLALVVEEVNRYRELPIVITDPSLRYIPISGIFDPRDLESFVAFIATLPGVSVERRAGGVFIRGGLEGKQ